MGESVSILIRYLNYYLTFDDNQIISWLWIIKAPIIPKSSPQLTCCNTSLSSRRLNMLLFGRAGAFFTTFNAVWFISFSDTQQENSHLLPPHPWACFPPWSQHEKDSLQGRTTFWCTHSEGSPSTDCRNPSGNENELTNVNWPQTDDLTGVNNRYKWELY